MKLNKLLLTALLMGFCLVATPATAGLITDWTYSLDYGFTSYSAGVTPDLNNPNGDPTKLSWGQGSQGPSSILVAGTDVAPPGVSNGVYTTNAAAQLAMSFTHDNNPITGTTLTEATLHSNIVLAGTYGLDFEIKFWETPNTPGDVDDIFYLVNPDDLVNQFVIDDYLYTLTFTIDGLVTLPASANTHFGVAGDLQGLLTPENEATSFNSYFTITAAPIPEPGTMILFGMGMIGMAGAIRRKM